ncbi:MAG TPA: tetratricopeptide repeat protein, partial [Chroococcales cyanobacterium]
EALSHASEDWILVLDADETLVPGSDEALREAMGGSHAACFLTVENLLAEGEIQTVRLLRLFKNRRGIQFRGRVHEQISGSLQDLGLPIGNSRVFIRHDGYTPALVEARDKHRRNLRLLEAALADDPDDLYSRYQLGKTFSSMGASEKAEKTFREVLEKLALLPVPEAYAFYPKLFVHLAAVQERLFGSSRALEGIREGVRLFPGDPEVLWHAGFYAREAGLWDEALLRFESAHASAKSPKALGLDFERLGAMAARSASDLWLKKATMTLDRDLDGAILAYRAALKYDPDLFFAHLALGTIYFERKRFAPALSALLEADRIRPGLPEIAFLIRECRRLKP